MVSIIKRVGGIESSCSAYCLIMSIYKKIISLEGI